MDSSEQSLGNTVATEDGVIILSLRGNQTTANMRLIREPLRAAIKALREAKEPVLACVDVSQVSSHTIGSRLASSKYLMEMDYDRVAVCGATGTLRRVADLIIQGSGRSGVIRQFDDPEAAVAWLHSAGYAHGVVS